MYEYRVINIHINGDIEHAINSMVDCGYEFVSLSAGGMQVVIVMKREKVIH